MVFACQRDSYLQTFRTKPVSCEATSIRVKKSEKINGFNVILEDTILFPEGGGQPDDRGTIAGISVLRVTRNKDKAVHFLETPLPPDEEVEVRLDWTRRFDHMQQHSGQHLLSAVAENEFGLKTTSWNLGTDDSYVELDVTAIETSVLAKLEDILNEQIRAAIPVSVKTYEERSEELKKAHTRGLPDDHYGPVRIVTIEGIDDNMCCGTHVRNLSELQMIKILFAEKGKKNKTNVHFLVGNRIIKYLQNCVEKERIFTKLLKGGPEQHVDLMEKMSKTLKLSQKNELTLIRDLAILEAQKFRLQNPKPSFFSLHRKEGNADFMSILVNELSEDENILLFITVGDDKGAGQITVAGKSDIVSIYGPKVGEIMDGKGIAKGNRYLGKVNNMAQRKKAEDLLKKIHCTTNKGDVQGDEND